VSKSKPLSWLHPKADGTTKRDRASAGTTPPTSSSDQCCVCGADPTCSTGGDRYCATHCPNQEHH
jgi:hypothetical protein